MFSRVLSTFYVGFEFSIFSELCVCVFIKTTNHSILGWLIVEPLNQNHHAIQNLKHLLIFISVRLWAHNGRSCSTCFFAHKDLFVWFQAEVFEKFLCGETLEQCYDAVASVANRWLDLLEVSSQANSLLTRSKWWLCLTHEMINEFRTMELTSLTVSFWIISLSQAQWVSH